MLVLCNEKEWSLNQADEHLIGKKHLDNFLVLISRNGITERVELKYLTLIKKPVT